jgi:hypothetical protein
MMVHGRTETKSPKNVKNVYKPTRQLNMPHFLHGQQRLPRLRLLSTAVSRRGTL